MSDKYEVPYGALLYAEQPLYDASDPTGVLAVSVHSDDDTCYCNIWKRIKGHWHKLMPERILEGDVPSFEMIQGEVYRYVIEVGEEIRDDSQMDLAVRGLSNIIVSKKGLQQISL